MRTRKEPTEEQKAKAAARKEKFRGMWKRVAAMPELERIQLSNKLGFVNVEGRPFSIANSMLLAMQSPAGSVFGGFRQWLKQGRAVRKGEHGAMIWVPIGSKSVNEPTTAKAEVVDGSESNGEADTRFIIGTVFDIGQTDEVQADHPVATVSPEIAEAFGMGSLPNVRVMESDGQLVNA